MAVETIGASALQTTYQPEQQLSSPPELDGDGMRAAGWLAESLSAPTVPIPNTVQDIAGPGGIANMGDAIIRGMQSVSEHYMKTTSELHASIEGSGNGMLGLQGALQMHMAFIEVSLEADVVSKCISKSTQNLDQLTKLT